MHIFPFGTGSQVVHTGLALAMCHRWLGLLMPPPLTLGSQVWVSTPTLPKALWALGKRFTSWVLSLFPRLFCCCCYLLLLLLFLFSVLILQHLLCILFWLQVNWGQQISMFSPFSFIDWFWDSRVSVWKSSNTALVLPSPQDSLCPWP